MIVIKLKSGAEFPALPLGIGERFALYDIAIDSVDKPALRTVVCFAALGLAYEACLAAEQATPITDRSVPPLQAKPWSACRGDLYAYGQGVMAALAAQGEDMLALRRVGDLIGTRVWETFHPPAEAVESARKNSDSEAAKSSASSGSAPVTSGIPSLP